MGVIPGENGAPPPAHSYPELECSVYGQAVNEYLGDDSEENRALLSLLTRELAAQRVPIAEASTALWEAAKPYLLSAANADRSSSLDAILDIERELCSVFEEAFQLERRAHLRLASAYSQKIREVNTILDSLPALAFLKDAEFHYVSVNRAFCDALGVPAGQIISKTDFDLFPEEVARDFNERDRAVMDGRVALRHEESLEFNGQPHTLLIIKAPVLNSDAAPTGLIGVGFDITARKRIEREHTHLVAALDSVGEAILITNTDGVIQHVNPAFERMTQYERDHAIGQTPRILKSGCHDTEFYRQLWTKITGGDVWRGIMTNRKRDGTLFETDQTIAPVRDAAGRVAGFVAVSRDITERKRMVETLQRAVMVKTEFTSMVSHELRTPLTAIKEAINVVEDGTAGPLNKHQADFLVLAKRNVDRLHRLINDTLDFSKIERGDFHLDLRMHDLNALTSEVVQQQRLAAKKEGLQLEQSLDDRLYEVRFDPDRISQVLVNLVGNAIRHGGGGWVEVTTSKVGDEAVVKVQDAGSGIPTQKLEHIFEAFVQLSTGPGRKVGGTGLGLAICKQIIELHGGRIWVESEVGKGSAFYFALRLADDNETEGS